MQITKEDIQAFIELYKKEFDTTLTENQAKNELSMLIQLYRLTYLAPKAKSVKH